MARDINKRLEQLRRRRTGTDRLNRVAADAQIEILKRSAINEGWLARVPAQSWTRYALGAMQEVGPSYTRISIDTADRVAKQLNSGLTALGHSVEFDLQGSVPLNVHIRGVSDVDLLTLDTSFLVYHSAGATALSGSYTSSQKTSLGVLSSLRKSIETTLPTRFPSADVDISGSKAVKISGGSLARPVDVVPSHWHDTYTYQQTQAKHDRGIFILDKKTLTTISNLPFLHIKRVGDRCDSIAGGLRKAIRLCKNVKADAVEEGSQIDFPSFDIAATMYHADQKALRLGSFYELTILAETQRFLDHLYHNPSIAKSLRTPDDSRVVFDTEEKYVGMQKLSVEVDNLLREVTKEQRPYLAEDAPFSSVRDAISGLIIPS
jgi:hypothetical protein